MSLSTTEDEKVNDGGYYAIKGFLYQFDVTISNILKNTSLEIEFENVQDINYEDYVIQVKHKETQKYNDSKIRKAVIQLFDLFLKDPSKKFCLYCYFKDIAPQKKILKLTELDNILGLEKSNYKRPQKIQFIKNLIIEFSHDYHTQFKELISFIKDVYNLPSSELAIYYHSIFRSKLLELVIKNKHKRIINKSLFDSYISNVKEVIFHSGYAEYLSRDKYEKLIKKQFFTIKKPNLDNFERLFVIDIDNNVHQVKLQKIIGLIRNKYFRRDKSPAPYIYFNNIEKNLLNGVKQGLQDSEVLFTDGTCFNGDRFRIDKMIIRDSRFEVKIINEEYLYEVMDKVAFQEIYQFFCNDLLSFDNTTSKHYKIQISETEQIENMIV